jgi:hypothetical protein
MKAQDTKAAAIRFGIEIETMIPITAGLSVGGYHRGAPVFQGRDAITGQTISPAVNGVVWKAERDGSIQCEPGFEACEFISPILSGDEGLRNLREMVAFINRIGAKVNRSCGLHVTIGLDSVIGTTDADALAKFSKILTNMAKKHAWAIYAQTGTDRHANTYTKPLAQDTPKIVKAMIQGSLETKVSVADNCDKYSMINLKKLFTQNAVEFRAFAGTTNEHKIFHHLATCLALVRRVSEMQNPGGFRKTKQELAAQTDAVNSLRYFWKFAGWTGGTREVALGLFGLLYSEWNNHSQIALTMAQKFQERFPNANL